MIRFAVFDQPEAPLDGVLRHAHLVGPDDVPVQGDIRFADGLIRCEKRGHESVALAVQFYIGADEDGEGNGTAGVRIGPVTLKTCLLPERQTPYLLSLELARHEIMLILNKLEEWALFDLPPDDPALVLFERSRAAFTEAVVAAGGERDGKYSEETDRLARQALRMAALAGESLTIEQARIQHRKRMSGELVEAAMRIQSPSNALTGHEAAVSRNALLGTVGVILPNPPLVGCTVSPEAITPGLKEAVKTTCDFIRMPMRWIDMEPTEGKYRFTPTDKWIEWAVREARLPIVGGPLIDFRPRSVPEWLYIWEHDYETLRELVYEHVKTLVTRYRRTVSTWTVVSGLHVNGNFTFTFEQVMDLTRLCVMVVRKLQPSARIQVEIDLPWGEYFAGNNRSIPPTLYAEMLVQAGVNVDVFALRLETGQPEMGHSARDLIALSSLLDRYAQLERPLAISAMSAPSEPPEEEALGARRQNDPGWWREEWSESAQRRWMTAVTGICLSKPFVHSVCWHELYATGKPSQMRHDALADAATGRLTGAGERFGEIRRALKAKQSPLELEHVAGLTPSASAAT